MFRPYPCDAGRIGEVSCSPPPRPNWEKNIYSRLALIGFTVGYGSLIYFPHAIEKYDATYLIPFFTLIILVGFPLFCYELSLGQYMNRGPIKAFTNLAPILSGLGWGMVLISLTTTIYYNLYLTESFILFVKYCVNVMSKTHNEDVASDFCKFAEGKEDDLPSEFYYEHLMGFMFSWLIVSVCISKGFQASTKVIYVVNVIPYYLLTLLVGLKIITMSSDGQYQERQNTTSKIFDFSWEQLAKEEIWLHAAKHVLFTLGIGFGSTCTLASYNKNDHNFIIDSVSIPIFDFGTSILATFLIYERLQPNEGDESILIILCSFSQRMFKEYTTSFIYLIFYMMGLACQLAMVETVITAILDQYEKLRHCHSYVVNALCFVLAIPGIAICMNRQVYESLKKANHNLLLIFGSLVALSAPLLACHFDKIIGDLKLKIPRIYNLYLKASWYLICPLTMMIFASVLAKMYFAEGHFSALEFVIILGSIMVTVSFSVYNCWKLKIGDYFRPLNDFCTNEERQRRARTSVISVIPY